MGQSPEGENHYHYAEGTLSDILAAPGVENARPDRVYKKPYQTIHNRMGHHHLRHLYIEGAGSTFVTNRANPCHHRRVLRGESHHEIQGDKMKHEDLILQLYRALWSRIGGRPWTAIIRENQKSHPLLWLLMAGTAGIVLGHLFW